MKAIRSLAQSINHNVRETIFAEQALQKNTIQKKVMDFMGEAGAVRCKDWRI